MNERSVDAVFRFLVDTTTSAVATSEATDMLRRGKILQPVVVAVMKGRPPTLGVVPLPLHGVDPIEAVQAWSRDAKVIGAMLLHQDRGGIRVLKVIEGRLCALHRRPYRRDGLEIVWDEPQLFEPADGQRELPAALL